VFAALGTALTVPQVSQRAFNDIWVVRCIMQLTATAWAVRARAPPPTPLAHTPGRALRGVEPHGHAGRRHAGRRTECSSDAA